MKAYDIRGIALPASRIAYGCMNLGGRKDRNALSDEERARAIAALSAALEQGITLFDHADIYMLGKSEQAFAQALQALGCRRDALIVQGKCGIKFAGDPSPELPSRYDFSYDHIVASVEGSLRRLQTDYLDLLLLHRPDALVEPDEVARAFDHLRGAGKVRAFGVSNHGAAQIALLQASLDVPLVVNQVQLSLLHHALIDDGVTFNTGAGADCSVPGLLDYCRLQKIRLQAWSPLARGQFSNPATAALVAGMAMRKGVAGEAIVLAWLLRHPAGIQPVLGSTDPRRIADACAADAVELSRDEWYQLFVAARGGMLP